MKTPTKSLLASACIALLATTLASSVDAQQRRENLPRNQDGGINNGVPNGVFTVVAVDSYGQTVQMQGSSGSPFNVYVGSDIFNISKLKAGDRIQVNFLAPDGLSNKLSAANIWPAQ